jgi:hypothetical protein
MAPKKTNLNLIKYFKGQVKPSEYFKKIAQNSLYDAVNYYGVSEFIIKDFVIKLKKLAKNGNAPLLIGDTIDPGTGDYFFNTLPKPDLRVDDFMVDPAMYNDFNHQWHIMDIIQFSAQTNIVCGLIELLLKFAKELLEAQKNAHPGVQINAEANNFQATYDLCMDLIARYREDGKKLADTKLAVIQTPDLAGLSQSQYDIREQKDFYNYYSESRKSKKLRVLRDIMSEGYGLYSYSWRQGSGDAKINKYIKYLNLDSGSREIVNFNFVFAKLMNAIYNGLSALSHNLRLSSKRKNSSWNPEGRGRLYDFWGNYQIGNIMAYVSKLPGAQGKVEQLIEDSLQPYAQFRSGKTTRALSTANKKILELIKIIEVDPASINIADTNIPEARPAINKRVKECAETARKIAKITPERDDIETIRLALKKTVEQDKIDLIIDTIFDTIEDCCAIADSFSGLGETPDNPEE